MARMTRLTASHAPLTPMGVLRRLGAWTGVCSVSAAPSFFVAASTKHDQRAMTLGVALFILLYTGVSCIPRVERFKRRPFVGSSLRFGYALRMVLSASMLVVPFALLADGLPGVLS